MSKLTYSKTTRFDCRASPSCNNTCADSSGTTPSHAGRKRKSMAHSHERLEQWWLPESRYLLQSEIHERMVQCQMEGVGGLTDRQVGSLVVLSVCRGQQGRVQQPLLPDAGQSAKLLQQFPV